MSVKNHTITDTFGNVVLEVMASGLVVVGYNYAASAALSDYAQSDYLAKFNHKLDFVACINSVLSLIPVAFNIMRHEARVSIKANNWQVHALKLEAVILDNIKLECDSVRDSA